MSNRIYLLTEGVHDVAFLARLLKLSLGLEHVSREAGLDPVWKRILPTKWPHDGSLRPAVPAPIFYRAPSSGTTVAVVNSQGISELARKLETHRKALALDGVNLDAVGVVLDADSQETPQQRFTRMADSIAANGYPRPAVMGGVAGQPRTGVFVLPGGGLPGTLEDLLLECAAVAYPKLRTHSEQFVDGLDRAAPEFMSGELKDLSAPAGRHKAVVAAMSAILKPGRPVQATIEDNRWIASSTVVLPRIAALVEFLSALTTAPHATTTPLPPIDLTGP
ncbi:DUF3226 domain-containing protein [Corallococcus macrosporus]|uniref:Uncharacterized protein n=1 Tax=Corallococcus macrosporus DSM 14697 TaxID=1189310 RepID=A0A250JWS6_9BACT|nr:DUF3226 domain-containing protein [Corallococcus macrosporus]ATB48173.1 hypothetical protein MYMAC_003799 [Corallococcus macrosporus DSM 14697]